MSRSLCQRPIQLLFWEINTAVVLRDLKIHRFNSSLPPHSIITAFLSENSDVVRGSNKGTAEVYKELFFQRALLNRALLWKSPTKFRDPTYHCQPITIVQIQLFCQKIGFGTRVQERYGWYWKAFFFEEPYKIGRFCGSTKLRDPTYCCQTISLEDRNCVYNSPTKAQLIFKTCVTWLVHL